jgi:hypothetical protein
MEESELTSVQGLSLDAMNLLISAGLMDSVSDQWPVAVQRRWRIKLEAMRSSINTMTEEVQEFASAWDEQGD